MHVPRLHYTVVYNDMVFEHFGSIEEQMLYSDQSLFVQAESAPQCFQNVL